MPNIAISHRFAAEVAKAAFRRALGADEVMPVGVAGVHLRVNVAGPIAQDVDFACPLKVEALSQI